MTRKNRKPRKLAHELLGLIAISALVAVVLFLILSTLAGMVAEEYCFQNDIYMTEFDWMDVDRWIFTASTLISVASFSILFLLMLSDRMDYIRTITRGIDALGRGESCALPLKGNNELTALAAAVHEMSAAQQQIREKEAAIMAEKEQFVRAMSHDIRTPLTSVLAYSEYLATEEVPPEQQKAHLQMIRKKAEQIRDLTDLLLDGSKRNPEHFDDAHLLMQQLAAEFEEGLEDFLLEMDLDRCDAFAASFDVQELRRIFDNLSSNIQKYADPARPVRLKICTEEKALCIHQQNAVRANPTATDSYGLGLQSIRRIAQFYDGQVRVEQTAGQYAITIVLTVE